MTPMPHGVICIIKKQMCLKECKIYTGNKYEKDIFVIITNFNNFVVG